METIEISIPEESIDVKKKYAYSRIRVVLPEGWGVDYGWSRGDTFQRIYVNGGVVTIELRKLIDPVRE
jgi:hypothetical protein